MQAVSKWFTVEDGSTRLYGETNESQVLYGFDIICHLRVLQCLLHTPPGLQDNLDMFISTSLTSIIMHPRHVLHLNEENTWAELRFGRPRLALLHLGWTACAATTPPRRTTERHRRREGTVLGESQKATRISVAKATTTLNSRSFLERRHGAAKVVPGLSE